MDLVVFMFSSFGVFFLLFLIGSYKIGKANFIKRDYKSFENH